MIKIAANLEKPQRLDDSPFSRSEFAVSNTQSDRSQRKQPCIKAENVPSATGMFGVFYKRLPAHSVGVWQV